MSVHPPTINNTPGNAKTKSHGVTQYARITAIKMHAKPIPICFHALRS